MRKLHQPPQDAFTRVTGHRYMLPDLNFPGVVIVGDEIGEGSADINAHHEPHADHSPVTQR
jgi:hypothetical protein